MTTFALNIKQFVGISAGAFAFEYYQMMKHRDDGRPLNREINLDDDLTVVTHNTKHFDQMPGIQCVDWVDK